MIRVGIVEDHPVFASALATLLTSEGFTIAFNAGTVADAIAAINSSAVDGVSSTLACRTVPVSMSSKV